MIAPAPLPAACGRDGACVGHSRARPACRDSDARPAGRASRRTARARLVTARVTARHDSPRRRCRLGRARGAARGNEHPPRGRGTQPLQCSGGRKAFEYGSGRSSHAAPGPGARAEGARIPSREQTRARPRGAARSTAVRWFKSRHVARCGDAEDVFSRQVRARIREAKPGRRGRQGLFPQH